MVLPRLVQDLKKHPSLELGELGPQHRGDLFLGNRLRILDGAGALLVCQTRIAVPLKPRTELLGRR